MRYRPGSAMHLTVGAILIAAVAGLAVTAAADDSYFGNDRITHWEVLTTRTGPGTVAVFLAGAGVAGALALGCLVRGLLPRGRAFALPLVLVVPSFAIAFLLAWVTLVGGD
ncbi:MAG TPA: hypothetical protein VFK71_04705 [Gaiellaceae bacterium]|nr:hypothetical protein [Gaiellaceae bacterium]